MGMDRLSLLANAVTQPDHAMHHPLAGVGHHQHHPFPPSSHLGTPAPPPHLASHHPGPYGYAAALASQSPDSPDSAPHHELAPTTTSALSTGGTKKKAARQMSQHGDDDGDGRDADGQPLRKRTKQSLSCGECKVRQPISLSRSLARRSSSRRSPLISLFSPITCSGGRSRCVPVEASASRSRSC